MDKKKMRNLKISDIKKSSALSELLKTSILCGINQQNK